MKQPQVKKEERRRRSRLTIALPGRYMLADGTEFSCEVVDVSPTGIALKGEKVGKYGERIVAYIKGLGRVEGFIVRRAIGWFALNLRAPQNKMDRLDERIAWLAQNDSPELLERREGEGADLWNERTVLLTDDGRQFPAELMDISLEGAAVLVDVVLPIGARVELGDQTAYVLRCFTGGLAVTFDDPADSVDGRGVSAA